MTVEEITEVSEEELNRLNKLLDRDLAPPGMVYILTAHVGSAMTCTIKETERIFSGRDTVTQATIAFSSEEGARKFVVNLGLQNNGLKLLLIALLDLKCEYVLLDDILIRNT